MKQLTVIVPIYNVEPYLERCLRSLQSQDISRDSYEIICLNDGSTDNSREVVLRLQMEFENIILIEQENSGVSKTRNNGIEKATGCYLMFIDPDDFVQENCLGKMIKNALLYKAQITINGYTFLNHGGDIQGSRHYNQYLDNVFPGLEAFSFTHKNGQVQADSSVGILFEADFINSNFIRYLPDVPFLEDGEFLARAHCLADRCIFMEGSFYFTVFRPGSATHSNLFCSEIARNGFLFAAKNLRNFQATQSLSKNQTLFLNGPIAQFVFLAIYSAVTSRLFKNLKLTVHKLKLLGLDKLTLDGCSGYYYICGKPYNFSPYLGALVVAMYLKIDRGFRYFLSQRELLKKMRKTFIDLRFFNLNSKKV